MKHLNFFNTEQAFADAHNTALGKAINRVRPVPDPVDHKREEQLRFERECHPLPDGTKLTTQQEALNRLNAILQRVWDGCAKPPDSVAVVIGDSVIGCDCAVGDRWHPQPYKAASFAPSSAAVDFGPDGSIHVTGHFETPGEVTDVDEIKVSTCGLIPRDEAQDPSRFYQLGPDDTVAAGDYVYSSFHNHYESVGYRRPLLEGTAPGLNIVVRKLEPTVIARPVFAPSYVEGLGRFEPLRTDQYLLPDDLVYVYSMAAYQKAIHVVPERIGMIKHQLPHHLKIYRTVPKTKTKTKTGAPV